MSDQRPRLLAIFAEPLVDKPYAAHEVKLLLIEPRGVPNTGEEGGARTADNDVWI